MLRLIKVQFSSIFYRKSSIFVFLALFCVVFVNFFSNINEFRGLDVIDLFHPARISALSGSSTLGIYFRQFFPLLVIIPAGFSYLMDKNANITICYQLRGGRVAYYYSNLIASFLVTFLVFTLPFFVEILLNFLVLPREAVGQISNVDFYQGLDVIEGYLFLPIYTFSTYLYVIVFILFQGFLSGALAMFTVAISTLRFMRFWVFLFLPVYFILFFVGELRHLLELPFHTSYFAYLTIFEGGAKSDLLALGFPTFLIIISIALVYLKAKEGEL